MSTTIRTATPAHPIARFARRVHEVLDTLTESPAWSMSEPEQRDVLLALARAEARLSELRLRVLSAADLADVAAESAATSTGAWLAQTTRATRPQAHADVQLARSLDSELPLTRRALADGDVSTDQARVIVRSVQALPDAAQPWVRVQAEKELVDRAADHDAKALAVLGRRIFDVVDPDAADHEEGRRLEAEERAAARATYLHLRDNSDGTHTGRFRIPSLHAAMLTKALHALTAPAQRRGEEQARTPSARPTRPELLGQGFCDLLERLPTDRLPVAGGVSATVLVLLDYETLVSGLGAVRLDTGASISAGEARRLACSAGIIPVVYRKAVDGRSVVLDAGRTRRLHTPLQRVLLTVQDGGCTAQGCDRPASWCQAHHDRTSWAAGGRTSVADGRLLCAFHHGKAHSPHYDLTHRPDGSVRFHRRT